MKSMYRIVWLISDKHVGTFFKRKLTALYPRVVKFIIQFFLRNIQTKILPKIDII
jgi:hypothetical protein